MGRYYLSNIAYVFRSRFSAMASSARIHSCPAANYAGKSTLLAEVSGRTYACGMQQTRGRWRALGLAAVLSSACGSNSHSGALGAAGTAGTSADSAGSTPASGAGGSHGGALGSAAGGPGEGGNGSSAGSGDSSPGFIAQIAVGQGGGTAHCLTRELPTGKIGSESDGRVPCILAELEANACDCSQAARKALDGARLTAMKKQLQLVGACGSNSGVDCEAFCGCEIAQAPGTAGDPDSGLHACQNDVTPDSEVNGFCVIDQGRTDENGAPAPLGNPTLVAECSANARRLLRFVGQSTPRPDAKLFLSCTAPAL